MALLVLCARTRLSSEKASEIRALVAAQPDWTRLLRLASTHTVTPLFGRSLECAARDMVPEEILGKLKEASRANTIRCLFLSAELAKILEDFGGESILAVPYKGPVAALQAYGDVALREFGDLDIILQHKDIPRAHELLSVRGYTPRFPWLFSSGTKSRQIPGEYNYTDSSRRVMVELHTERTLRHFPVTPEITSLASPFVPVEIAGQTVLTFSPEVALVLLCLHGAKDFWERLSWVVDVSELVESRPEMNWEAVFTRAQALRSLRIVLLGLWVAREFLGTQLPRDVARRLDADRVSMLLARRIKACILGCSGPGLGALERFHFRRLLVPGVVAGARYSLRLTLAPSEDDWSSFTLPRALSALYPILRPLRLLRKYGVRRGRTESSAPASQSGT